MVYNCAPGTTFVGGRFVLSRQLASGAYGSVFVCRDRQERKDCAIKIEYNGNTVRNEKTCYLQIGVSKYTPRLIAYSENHIRPAFLVMSYEGISFENIMKSHNWAPIPPTKLLWLAEHAIRALRGIHKCRVVHRDVRPANFCLSLSNEKSPVLVLDFGLSSRVLIVNGIRIYEGHGQTAFDQAHFASLHVSGGNPPQEVCDLHSLGYNLLEMRRAIPWTFEATKQQRDAKKAELTANIAATLPKSEKFLFKILKEIFNQTTAQNNPDYSKILDAIKHAEGYEATYEYQ